MDWSPRNCAGFGFLSPCSKYCRQRFFNGLWDAAMLPEMTRPGLIGHWKENSLKRPLQYSEGRLVGKTIPSFHSSLLFISILATLQTQHHSNSKSSSKPSDWICLVFLLVDPMNHPQGRSLHTSAFAALSNASQRRLGGSAATTASWIHQRAWLLVQIPQDLPDYMPKRILNDWNKSHLRSHIISYRLLTKWT